MIFDFLKKKTIKKKIDIDNKIFKYEYENILFEIDNKYSQENWYYENNICPNCGTKLETKISTSKKCKYCKQNITKRGIYLNNKNYLFGADAKKLYSFKKLQDKLKDLNYYEQKMYRSSGYYPMKKLVAERHSKIPDEEFKDLAFHIYAELYADKVFKARQEYYRVLKTSDHISGSYSVQHEYRMAYILMDNMLDILAHQDSWNVYISTLPQYAYGLISSYYLARSLGYPDDATPRVFDFYLDDIVKYYSKYTVVYNVSINELKDNFMKFAGHFFIDTISKEDAWRIIEKNITNLL